MGRLDGLVAIVTGAARGQGAAEARAFVAEGARVVLTDIDGAGVAATAATLGEGALAVAHDVASEESWGEVTEQALAAFGRIDILVNNAAIYRVGRLEETSAAQFEHLFRVNQLGVFLGMRAVVPAMRAVGGGAIINVSSVAGLSATPGMIGYGATKWAVRGMTKSVALDLARDRIRVNSIHPGVIDTPMLAENTEKMNQAMVGATPMRRMGTPDEVAEAAVYLASPAAAFVTGAELTVDGGLAL